MCLPRGWESGLMLLMLWCPPWKKALIDWIILFFRCLYMLQESLRISRTSPAAYHRHDQHKTASRSTYSFLSFLFFSQPRFFWFSDFVSFVNLEGALLKEERDPRVRRNCDTPVQSHKYKYTNTNMQIQIHKYKYTNTIMQIQIWKYKYANTCSYLPPLPRLAASRSAASWRFHLFRRFWNQILTWVIFWSAATMPIEIFITELPVEVF